MSTVFEKTWQHDFNRVPSDNTSVIGLSRSFAWWLKAFLTGQIGGATTGLWTCIGSSDAVTGALDGVDRWGATFDATKLFRPLATSASCTITVTTGGTWSAGTYRAMVAAKDGSGNYGASFESAAVAVPLNDQIIVTWGAVAGAAGYRIWLTPNGGTGTAGSESLFVDVGAVTTTTIAGPASMTAGTPSAVLLGAHSWITLRSPVITTPNGNQTYYCTIDLAFASDVAPLWFLTSKAAPTGGSAVVRPTATDEWSSTANASLSDGTTGTMHFSGSLSTDGLWHFFGHKVGAGFVALFGAFHILAESRANDAYPAITAFAYFNTSPGPCLTGGNTVQFANINNTDCQTWRQRSFDGGSIELPGLLRYSGQNNSLGNFSPTDNSGLNSSLSNTNGVDYVDGMIGDLPIYVYISPSTAVRRSIRGRFFDIRYQTGGQSTPAATVEPVSGPVTSAVIASLWVPANAAPIL